MAKGQVSSLVQFYWITLLCRRYFVRDFLRKHIFGQNAPQSPTNFKFWTFSITLSIFSILNDDINQASCVKVPNVKILCYCYFA